MAIEEVCSSAHTPAIDESWILDSGASRHMTSKKEWYSSWKPLQEPINVIVGNDAKIPAEGLGNISFLASTGEKKQLTDVLYVPKIKRNFAVNLLRSQIVVSKSISREPKRKLWILQES